MDTAQILFSFLGDILYAPQRAALDLDSLDPAYRKLGEGLLFLAECIREEKAFLKALTRGDLSAKPPDIENTLAGPAKELQGALRHLAWQTKQVAKGDYSQQVDFMGEFSQAFNTMTAQLQERTAGLIAEKERVEQKNEELSRNLELVLALTNYTHNMIFVFSRDMGRQIFLNHSAEWFMRANPYTGQSLRRQMIERPVNQESEHWETELKLQNNEVYFDIESFPITWSDESAAVHIVMDNTERKKRESMIYSMAYRDPLTGLSNRRYALDLMGRWRREKRPFLLSFIDVDYLKYCNDTFGHAGGDQYLMEVSLTLQTLGGELCRTGGDEFLLLQEGTDAKEQDDRLAQLRKLLKEQTDTPYPKSFSFATLAVPPDASRPMEDYINEADERMYQYKLANKTPLGTYRDERVL